MRKIVEKLGRFMTVILVTLATIIASLILTNIVHLIIDAEVPPSNTIVSIIVPAIIAPIVSFPFFTLLFKVFELEDENRILAAHDPVTGLMSRRALIAQAASLLSFAQRKQTAVSMLFIDIDNFKTINDKHGHLIGDNALHRVGQYINAVKRDSDLIARFGGDELIAFLPDTNKEGALHFAEKLHAVLKENPFKVNNEPVHLALSIGVTTHKPNTIPIDIDEMIRQSDLALYDAKQRGKNCTVNYIADDEFELG